MESREENEITELLCEQTFKDSEDFEREACTIFKFEQAGVKDRSFSSFLSEFLEAQNHMTLVQPGPDERLKFCQTLISKVVNDEKKIEERIYFPESKKHVHLPRIVFLAKDITKGSFVDIADHMVPYLSLRKEDRFPHFLGFLFSIGGFKIIWIKGHKLCEETVQFIDVSWTPKLFDSVKKVLSHNEPLCPIYYRQIYRLYFVMEFIKKVVHA